MLIEPPSTILVTGIAGFVGFHAARKLLDLGSSVVGIDNLNPYYDPKLKQARLALLPDVEFHELDFSDSAKLFDRFGDRKFDAILHLGAQAGVRYSLESPATYIQSNIVGTGNLLELARQGEVGHFVYASSSSVYGLNRKLPFSENDSVDHPISLYAATKKSCEVITHSYSHLYGLPSTGLRFFTVYGPWGRPDMAIFKFTKAILAGEPIDVYNEGRMRRDFTYVDDIVDGVVKALKSIPGPDPTWDPSNPTPATSSAPFRVYNIGNHQSVELLKFIEVLEAAIGKRATLNLLPMQPGDVLDTYADTSKIHESVGYQPTTPIELGVPRFVEWYRSYYDV